MTAATTNTKKLTREEWLEAFTNMVRPAFEAAGAPIPEKVRVSVGFPSKRALSRKNRVIGECWSGAVSKDKVPHIFISPVLEERDVGHVLIHELVHAAVGCECGHKGAFAKVARKLGLAGKLTATVAGPELAEGIAFLCTLLGDYPHSAINASELEKRKQGTRLLKLECECGRILRATRAVIEQGPITCGACGGEFKEPGAEGANEDEAGLELAAASKGGAA